MNVFAPIESNSSYKTIELAPELLEVVEQNEDLYFRSSKDGFAVLCSNNKTFALKKKNHSNTVILGYYEKNGAEENVLGFTTFDSDFECTRTHNKINSGDLPIYHRNVTLNRGVSMEQLRLDSPMSDAEFYKEFYEINGSEVNGVACILSDQYVTECLNTVILSMVGHEQDLHGRVDTELLHSTVDSVPKKVLATVLAKFTLESGELDAQKIAVWYGIEALRQHAQLPVSEQEFLIKWKSAFPSAYETPVELKWLKGNYCRPLMGKIRYFSRSFLPQNVKERFAHLFKVQNTWELHEMVPFIEDLNVKGIKMDKFVIKYARKKVENGKVLISSRM